MPFLYDIEGDDEALRRPIWGTFVLLKNNLERLIAVNIGWSLQLIPALAALSFVTLPAWIRVLLLAYSAIAFIPATGVLYTLMAYVCQDELLRLDMLPEEFRRLALPSLTRLTPLFGGSGLFFWLTLSASALHILLLDVLMRFMFIMLIACSLYYGPLFAEDPTRSPLSLFRQSALLTWRYPGQTALTALIILLATLLGAISIGGLFLIIPVLVALLQTRRCYTLLASKRLHKVGIL